MNPDKTKIILVGNSMFPRWGDEIKDIPNVEQNLDRLKKIFFDANYFGIPDDLRHLVEIRNETSQEILLKVKHETKSSDQKEDFEKLIFYYSGHGIPGEDRKLFFAAKDTVRKDYELTSVDSSRLFSYLKAFEAQELIIILDCCYAAQTRENQGDADSVIEKCLPPEEAELDENENGTYYLFAAGRDNVAKFNPAVPNKPTFFTDALLTVVETGTESDEEIITTGELFQYLCKQINKQKRENPAISDIPDPRQGTEGNAGFFHFCKNKRHTSEDDKAWAELLKDPTSDDIKIFLKNNPETRYQPECEELRKRIFVGKVRLDDLNDRLNKLKDGQKEVNKIDLYDAALQLKKDYKDIPRFSGGAEQIINELEDGMRSSPIAENEKNAPINRNEQTASAQALQDLSKAVGKSAEANKESSTVTDNPVIRTEKNDKAARSFAQLIEQRP
jgi:hypothetical protein